MTRPAQLHRRLQRCIWLVGAALASTACQQPERLLAPGDDQEEIVTEDIRDGAVAVSEDGAFVRGDRPDSPSSSPLSRADEERLLAGVAADVSAIQELHVVGVSGATPACDESACVYFCDEICLDVDPREQAARVATLLALAEQASEAANQASLSDADWSDDGQARLEEDLLVLHGLAVVDGLSFDDAADECPSCYQFTIDEMNIRRKIAIHALAEAAVSELGAPQGSQQTE